jgi:hypothetical protein
VRIAAGRTRVKTGLRGFYHPAPSGLFWLLQPLALAESYAGAAAVFVDEFNASQRNFGFFLPKIKPQRGHGRYDANGSVIRWCFADPAIAKSFAAVFGASE